MTECIISPGEETLERVICPMISKSELRTNSNGFYNAFLIKVYCNNGIPSLDFDDFRGSMYFSGFESNNDGLQCKLWNGKNCSLFREQL